MVAVSGGSAEFCRLFDLQFLHHGPEEPDEFSSHGDGRDARGLSGRDAVIKLVEVVLSLPSMADDRRGLAALSPSQLRTHRGSVPVVPGRLDEHMATATVARLGADPFQWTGWN